MAAEGHDAHRAGNGAAHRTQADQASDGHRHDAPARVGVERSTARYSPPHVSLVDQEGARVSLHELLETEQPVLLNFIFTTCTAVCPPMTATFADVQKRLGADREQVRMISVSIDPEQDRPEVLARYGERFGAADQWRFLTGQLEDCIAVQKAFDAYRGDKMDHAALTLVRARPGEDWVRYEGFAAAEQLVRDVRAALSTREGQAAR
jgi:protein SCO1/2